MVITRVIAEGCVCRRASKDRELIHTQHDNGEGGGLKALAKLVMLLKDSQGSSLSEQTTITFFVNSPCS